jgi:hypothetical protein
MGRIFVFSTLQQSNHRLKVLYIMSTRSKFQNRVTSPLAFRTASTLTGIPSMSLLMYPWSMSVQQACTCSQSMVARVGSCDILVLSRCQTSSMGLRLGEEGGWMREGIPNSDLASFASLQVWQEAPSSTTRMSCYLAHLSCLVACLSRLLSTILTYFSPFICFPFSCISLGGLLSRDRPHFLP